MRMQIAHKSQRNQSHHPKHAVAFKAVANQFISEQHARGNADAMIKHYEQTIRKNELFPAYYAAGEKRYLSRAQEDALGIGRDHVKFFIRGSLVRMIVSKKFEE